jgi:hypothetical protein
VLTHRRFHDLDVMRDAESAGRYAPSTLMHPRFGGLTAAAKLCHRLRRLCPSNRLDPRGNIQNKGGVAAERI